MAISKRVNGTIGNCCCGTCPAPTCSNCSAEPTCPPGFRINGEDLQLTPAFDISADNWPTVEYSDSGGCVDFSVFNSTDDQFAIINFTSGADLKAQIENFLVVNYGGSWTVTINVSGSNFTITDISGTGTTLDPGPAPPAEFIFATCASVEQSAHIITATTTQNCSGILANHPMTNLGGILLIPGSACTYSYTDSLGGSCNLDLVVTVTLNPTNVQAVVELKDGATVISNAVYTSGALSAPYFCDVDTPLSLTSNDNGGQVNWDDTTADFLGAP